jgi:hypothetical protein
MYDKGKIIPMLIIFVILVTFPFLYNIGKASHRPEVSIDTPVINQMSKKQCIKSAEIMRAEHMKILDKWREAVIRDGDREYGIIDGVKYEKSLQKTCMHCHSNKKAFCDRCHDYVNVKPYCWNCHIEPEE